MKVSIIGGGGRVGSCAAFALECMGLVSEMQIIDANVEAAEGEALDLLHGAAVLGGQRINTGCYKRAADTDIFVITAGLRRKPDESRLDLINRNVSLFRQILASIKEGGYKKDAFVFVVSNPVDILTYIAAQELDLPRERVIGLGTMLDTSRFRALIAKELKVPATQVSATVKSVIDNYTSEYINNETSEFNQRVQELARTVVNQLLVGTPVICEGTMPGSTEGNIICFACVELTGKSVMEAVASKISNDEKLRTDYEYEKFKKVFEEEMAKMQ